jgi:hypothetical protein
MSAQTFTKVRFVFSSADAVTNWWATLDRELPGKYEVAVGGTIIEKPAEDTGDDEGLD